jgi:hypothetical protein
VKSFKNIIICILLLSSISLCAYNSIEKTQYLGFKDEGPFVESPTYFGSATGYIIMTLTAAILTEPIRLVSPNSPLSDKIGYYMVTGCSKGVGAAFGFAPYLIKKIFYDTPLWMLGKQTPTPEKVKSTALPKELVTPGIPADFGEIKNVGIDEEDLPHDKEEEPQKEKSETVQEKITKSKKPKEIEKKAIKVDPDLPLWIQNEINKKDNVDK